MSQDHRGYSCSVGEVASRRIRMLFLNYQIHHAFLNGAIL